MANKEQIFTRVDPDVKSAIEEYCDERGITQSEAIRRWIHSGLREDGDSPFLEQLGSSSVFVAGLAAAALAFVLIVAAALLFGAVPLAVAIAIGAIGQVTGVVGAGLLLVNWSATRATDGHDIIQPIQEAHE